ncbi:HNH endonuclease [Clostridium perfringens]|uniref:HNH endonuclease n=1 Tax=Clostridium perfringens TaxID=1502 RepID=UPI0018E411F4|nr:HNH endonuclease [Clostridium perfringens]MBI6087291.1 HNH endonuclease [Clostridium perfringens]MBI6092782.1 HNH endonuclease [Clostridium perfringens]UBK26494.1 HNH endonuclease [Clostridium perfringens]
MQNIKINNNIYFTVDSLTVNLSDSFVSPNNKIGTGSGEARLYISSQNSTPLFTFSSTETISKKGKTYPACTSTCYLLKENLIDYLYSTHNYYLNPIENHNRNILSFYNERERLVNNLPDLLPFNIYMQNGELDSTRFYIGCIDDAWNIIRELSIPLYSQLNIYKLRNNSYCDDIIYIFTLTFTAPNTPYNRFQSEESLEINIKNDTNIDSTERTSLIKARNGQGKFRSNVIRIMPRCPFTDISDSFMLRASHIIPWSQCRNNHERLDGYNGLTLTPSYDVLFDKGLISFNNDGSLIISSKLNQQIITSLNLIDGQVYNINNSTGNRNLYLQYHRDNIFKR